MPPSSRVGGGISPIYEDRLIQCVFLLFFFSFFEEKDVIRFERIRWKVEGCGFIYLFVYYANRNLDSNVVRD